MTQLSTDHDLEIPTLFQHAKRPSWGLAILAWETATKRGFQFQDGQMRAFKEGFYKFMKPVDRPMDEAMKIARELEGKLVKTEARAKVEREARKQGRKLLTLEDQLAIFQHLFPGGFQDPTWLSDVRGEGASSRRKRHRDPAIAHAQELLAKEALDKASPAEVHAAALEVAKRCDIASPSTDLSSLSNLPEDRFEAYAAALRGALYGSGPYAPRLAKLIDALSWDGSPTWPIVTLLQSLVQPDEHIAIKPSVFRAQARWMAPSIAFDNAPSAVLYDRLLTMSRNIRDRLKDKGLEPQDMQDVYQFVWETMRPKAKQVLEQLGD